MTAREAVISGTTQGLPTPSQVQLRLFLAMREGRLSNLEMTWKSAISKPRIKLDTLGICILFGFGEEDEFEGAANAVILLPWGVSEAGQANFHVTLVVHGGHEVFKACGPERLLFLALTLSVITISCSPM